MAKNYRRLFIIAQLLCCVAGIVSFVLFFIDPLTGFMVIIITCLVYMFVLWMREQVIGGLFQKNEQKQPNKSTEGWELVDNV